MRKERQIISQGGFTLVEILVAMSLMLIITVAFVPLFVYIGEVSQGNRAQLVATNLASGVVEEIRSLSYSDVGLVGGNPKGVVEHETTRTIEGRQYTITTNIWWVEDASDDTSGSDSIPYDYKRVQVTVTSPGLFNGGATMTEDINTLASLEGEEEAFPGGNIRAQAVRGWRTTPGENVPVKDVQVKLTAGPDAPQTIWTNETGKALFAILGEGSYTIEADASDQGMMVYPMKAEQPAVVVQGVTTGITFEVEYPCRLVLNLLNADSGAPISTGGDVVLETPYAGKLTKTFTADMGGVLRADFLGDLWPVGAGYAGAKHNLRVQAKGYLLYDLSENPEVWNGLFNAPGESRTLTLRLTPATASVTAVDAGSGAPLAGAAVDIYLHTYTFSGGGWVGSCSDPASAASAVTLFDGSACFDLADNNLHEPPAVPQGGDQYTRYCISARADGYQPGLQHDAFWVSGGRQITDAGAVETCTIKLQPTLSSIRVRAENQYGYPRDNISIRVTGPGYDKIKLTGSGGIPGEVLFDALPSNQPYNVYRRSGSSWTDLRSQYVGLGEYYVLYRYWR